MEAGPAPRHASGARLPRTLSHLAPAGRDHTDRDAFFAHALVVATGPADLGGQLQTIEFRKGHRNTLRNWTGRDVSRTSNLGGGILDDGCRPHRVLVGQRNRSLQPGPHTIELKGVEAAELATATFPLGAGLTDTTGRRLIDAILAVLGDPLTVFGSLFRTADKDADVDPALRDHIVRGYLTAVLRDQAAFVGPTQPWLPASLKLSNSVSAALLGRLPELIGWSDRADPVIRARVVLFVAKLAESLGWTVGEQARVVGLVVGARAEDALLPLLLAGTPLLPAGGWPPVPSWLWTRCLEPALNDVLTGRTAGASRRTGRWSPGRGRVVAAVTRGVPSQPAEEKSAAQIDDRSDKGVP